MFPCPILRGVSGKRSAQLPSTGHGELALIGALRRRAQSATVTGNRSGLRLGIGDDCALLRVEPNEELAVTTDLSIAGRHFDLGCHPAESVGHRTLARGLSDLAAMGARPVAAFLSLGLPRELATPASRRDSFTWMSGFLDGLLALAREHKVPLAGGDLAESPLVVADIVLAGAVARGRALLRSRAKPGDLLYVTGTLGGAAAALERLIKTPASSNASTSRRRLKELAKNAALAPHLFPQPRITQGLWLQRHAAATAAIDLSDGLSTDLTHLCEESRVAAEIDPARLPISPQATLEQALHGGEDYELLFAARPRTRLPEEVAGIPITQIGRIVRARSGRSSISILGSEGPRLLEPHGWQHFA